jgi:hypothetical protein
MSNINWINLGKRFLEYKGNVSLGDQGGFSFQIDGKNFMVKSKDSEDDIDYHVFVSIDYNQFNHDYRDISDYLHNGDGKILKRIYDHMLTLLTLQKKDSERIELERFIFGI